MVPPRFYPVRAAEYFSAVFFLKWNCILDIMRKMYYCYIWYQKPGVRAALTGE